MFMSLQKWNASVLSSSSVPSACHVSRHWISKSRLCCVVVLVLRGIFVEWRKLIRILTLALHAVSQRNETMDWHVEMDKFKM